MKKILISSSIFLVILVSTAVIGWAEVGHQLFMPMVFCENCPPPPTITPTPTVTKTPKPPTPTPTNTPTYIPAEGGNSCVYVDYAWRNSDGSTTIAGLVPSICSYMVEYDVQGGGTLLIVNAERIKTDTYGCMEGDFGYWPPIDYPCPPPPDDELRDEWGRILWGDFETLTHPDSFQKVCGYCAECGYPYTRNCVEVYNPKD